MNFWNGETPIWENYIPRTHHFRQVVGDAASGDAATDDDGVRLRLPPAREVILRFILYSVSEIENR